MAELDRARAAGVQMITRYRRPVAAGAKHFQGGLVVCNADGFFAPATSAIDLVLTGRAAESVDNSGGANGDVQVDVDHFVERRVLLLANDVANPVTRADVERPCFIVDDQTVSNLGTGRSVAGIVFDVTDEGVWVEVPTARVLI